VLDRLFDFLADFMDLFVFWVVLDEYEEGVVLRLGKYKKSLGKGLHLILPCNIDNVLVDNVVPTTDEIGEHSLVTADGKAVLIDGIVRWRIEDIRKILLEVEDSDDVLIDSTSGVLSQLVSEYEYEDLRSKEFKSELMRTARRIARKSGVEILDIQITDLAQPIVLQVL